jgi:PPM family protein phosphatase
MPQDGYFVLGNTKIAFKTIGALFDRRLVGGHGEFWKIRTCTAMRVDEHETERSKEISLIPMSPLYFATAARSAVGLVRKGNEDSALTSPHVIAVADGMGGHAAGEVASKIAISALAEITTVITHPDIDSDSADDLYAESLHTIDAEIKGASQENPELSGMGTTLTSLFISQEKIALLHIGDSRAYRLRANSLEQLSLDHTVVQELISQGTISESDIASHPQRSVLTQVLMGDGISHAPLLILEGKVKDRYLVCSDGLSSVLTEKEIKSLIKGKDRKEAVDALIDATYINGAPDNVTVIIADLVETDPDNSVLTIGAAQ